MQWNLRFSSSTGRFSFALAASRRRHRLRLGIEHLRLKKSAVARVPLLAGLRPDFPMSPLSVTKEGHLLPWQREQRRRNSTGYRKASRVGPALSGTVVCRRPVWRVGR